MTRRPTAAVPRSISGSDWQVDAERRDFTINALYANQKGEIIDLVGGLEDIESRTVRFIGAADARVAEDYLRVLRYFRFYATLREPAVPTLRR
jgi:poly(A) polymerase